MFKWTYGEKASTEATAEQIWTLWQDTSAWSSWDSELKWVKLNGDFIEGTTGRMKPVNGPEVEFKLSRVERYRAFSDIARLPLTNLVFDHEYFKAQKEGDSAYICHSVTMKGWLAPIFARIIGNKIKSHLRIAMTELCKRAIMNDKKLSTI